ncbi:MAG: membrane protein insertion efficiency factor YidD [Thermodesulfobacteriota bacterium]
MHLTCRIFPMLFAGIMLFAHTPGICGEVHSPEPVDNEARGQGPDAGGDTNVGVWLASFFRDHISAVDGSRCPSLPTCSSYSIKAFKKHGFFIGWAMMADRLVHEIDEWAVSPVRMVNGQPKIIDPVENNDFWWFQADEQHER